MAPVLDIKTDLDATMIHEIARVTGIIRYAYPALYNRMVNTSELVKNPLRFENDFQLHEYLGFLQHELNVFRSEIMGN